MVAWRELLVFRRSPARLLVTLVQPLAILLLLGAGLDATTHAIGGMRYSTYVFPGVVAMATIMPSFFTAGSVVQDREFGFLREMLVAPPRRATIVGGKLLGSTLVATLHAAVVVAFGPLVHVPLHAATVLELLALAALLAATLSAIGLAFAARAASFQAYMSRVNLVALPMLIASGALYPLSGLPTWLAIVTRLNPVAYAVDPMRRAVFPLLSFSEPVAQQVWLVPPELRVTWGEWIVPVGVSVALLAGIALVAAGIATRRLSTHA
jgi:ABC-2 type transport system permease protein